MASMKATTVAVRAGSAVRPVFSHQAEKISTSARIARSVFSLGEQLGTYLNAAKEAFSENTERAVPRGCGYLFGLVRKNGI